MTLSEVHNVVNFYINKYIGGYYTPSEIDLALDRGQMALFTDFRSQYATSQRIQDALAPFLNVWDFNTSQTVSGYIVVPSNLSYMTLLDIQISFQISNRTVYAGVPVVNKDERANRLNSQLDPVTITSPICEMIAPRYFKLYPTNGYTGSITFFRRPAVPNLSYTTISGRVIVPNDAQSTNLEWPEDCINMVIIKSLSLIGINLSDQDISGFAQVKSQQNFQNVNNS